MINKYLYNILSSELIFLSNKRCTFSFANPLVICDAGIGDLLMSTPMIQKLSEQSGSPVDVVTNRKSIGVIINNPYINRIFLASNVLCDTIELVSFLNSNLYSLVVSVKTPLQLLNSYGLRGTHGYWSSNPQYERLRPVSRVLSRLSTAYKKYYYARKHAVELIYGLIMNTKEYKVEYLPQMYPSEVEIREVESILCDTSQYIVIHVGGQDEIRKLRIDVLVKVIKNLSIKCYLVGGKEDWGRAEQITMVCDNVKNITGQLSLNQTYLLLKRSSVCIAPDSVVMHIATTAGAPLVAIMGNALPETFGPYPMRSNIRILSRQPKCSPCSRKVCDKFSGHSCVQDIRADEILDCIQLLACELFDDGEKLSDSTMS